MKIPHLTFEVLPKLVQQGVKLTPMMEQFYEVKLNYPQALLFFRMGDFYELFFEDAEIVSRLINITLTTRGQIANVPIPMAGIPHHAAAQYVDKLTTLGLRVVICDQVEDPKMAKGIVKRAVVQICSPGLPFDIDRSANSEQHLVAAATKIDSNKFLLAMVDFVHGDFFSVLCEDENMLFDYLRLYQPKEFLTYLGQYNERQEWATLWEVINTTPTYLSEEYFHHKNSKIYMNKIAPYLAYDAFLRDTPAASNAIFILCYYLHVTQKLETLSNLKKFRWVNPSNYMRISFHTLAGLEIVPKHHDELSHTLLGWADQTITSMGYRLLKEWFMHPLKNSDVILQRQNHIKLWKDHWNDLNLCRNQLENVRDIHRILAKTSTGKIQPSDMLNLARSFTIASEILTAYPHLFVNNTVSEIARHTLGPLTQEILSALNDELGAHLEKGNLFKPGYNQERDKLSKAHLNTEKKILALEENYRKKYDLPNLRIRANNISGHYIEVSKTHGKRAPSSFKILQTLTNVERFQSEELIAIETEFLKAKEKLKNLESELFENLATQVLSTSQHWLELAQWIATTDVFQSMAYLAEKEKLSCPHITTQQCIDLDGLWHPLLKDRLRERFIEHKVRLDDSTFFALITGPNMAGKTTVMREVAIAQFLMQVGSFVPAKRAHISIADALFSRLGASDDILNGQSTFMVEMCETAEILRNSTSQSLILLDEIGRGTSTYDGLSLAWAIMEYLCREVKAFTLFSTHYHELVEAAEGLAGAKNFNVKTAIKNKNVTFLYELVEGGTTQSYGLYVAKIAGLPSPLLKQAEKILAELENPNGQGQLKLFDTAENIPSSSEIETELSMLNIEQLTPINALLKLKSWQDQIRQ